MSAVLSHNFNKSYDNIVDKSLVQTSVPKENYFYNTAVNSNIKESKCVPNLQENLIEKVLKLLTDPHSSMLYERHVHQLKILAKHCFKGFLLKDLNQLSCIIAAISVNISNYSNILPTLTNILAIFGHPFIKFVASDEYNYKEDAIEMASQFAYLIELPYTEVRTEICKSIKSLYVKDNKFNHQGDLNVVSKEYLRNIIDRSTICDTLMQVIPLVASNGTCLLLVLDLLKELTHESAINCNRALSSEGVLEICDILTADSGKDTKQIKYICIEVIWNLIEFADVNLVNKEFNNVECISAIKEAFIDQLNISVSDHDREFRNDLLSVSSLLFRNIDIAKYILLSGYAKYIAILATYQEVKSHNILVKHLKLTNKTKEDFELKKLLLECLISMYKNDREIIQLYSENHIIPTLLYYLVPDNSEVSWKGFQRDELQLLCLKVLSCVGRNMHSDFIQFQGPKFLLEFIDCCFDPDMNTSSSSQISSTYPLQMLQSKISHLHTCIFAMKNIILSRDKDVVDDFAMHGIFERCLALLQVLTFSANCEIIYVQTQIDIMDILSEICVTDAHYKEMFGNLGVDLLLPRLTVNLNEVDAIYVKLVASTVNCLWSTVIANFTLEDYFMEKSGIFSLLNQLQTSPEALKSQLIGCLLDLSSNPKSVNHFLIWKGKGCISAPHLFCELWRGEDAKLLAPRNKNNVIADLENPLKGGKIISSKDQEFESGSVSNVFNNIRAKIYGIFSIIGFIDLPPLEYQDHITLIIIQNYMNLKLAEIWEENISELKAENIRPITPDQEALEIIGEGMKMRVEEIVKTQNEIVKAHEAQELQQEQQCYIQIRELHLQDEYEMKKFNEYLERTSNYNSLKEAKNRMTSAINASRKSSGYTKTDSFQKTTLDNLNITNFPGKKLQILKQQLYK